jgi:hypothetical protein
MSKTPIFDEVLAASDADLWETSSVFPIPEKYWGYLPTKPVDNREVQDTVDEIEWTSSAPEPTLKTFVRCLWWWKP